MNIPTSSALGLCPVLIKVLDISTHQPLVGAEIVPSQGYSLGPTTTNSEGMILLLLPCGQNTVQATYGNVTKTLQINANDPHKNQQLTVYLNTSGSAGGIIDNLAADLHVSPGVVTILLLAGAGLILYHLLA